jgi:Stress responsive A/B Barrel Domain
MNSISRKTLLLCAIATVFSLGVAVGQNKFGQPKSILHIITVQWNADSTAEQRQAAINGVKTMASQIPGITNVWLKTLKVQGKDPGAVIVMEFKDKAAFDAYAAHPAHKKWEEIYLPIRQLSHTHDITN